MQSSMMPLQLLQGHPKYLQLKEMSKAPVQNFTFPATNFASAGFVGMPTGSYIVDSIFRSSRQG